MTKKKAAVVGSVAAVVVTGGVAFAYWTSDGTGTGTATTGDAAPWEVTLVPVDHDNLSPDGPTETISFSVKNNGSGVQHLNTTTASVVDTSDAGCTSADFAVGLTTLSNVDVAAGGTVNGTFTLQMIDTGVPQDDCKNATVNLEVVAD